MEDSKFSLFNSWNRKFLPCHLQYVMEFRSLFFIFTIFQTPVYDTLTIVSWGVSVRTVSGCLWDKLWLDTSVVQELGRQLLKFCRDVNLNVWSGSGFSPVKGKKKKLAFEEMRIKVLFKHAKISGNKALSRVLQFCLF